MEAGNNFTTNHWRSQDFVLRAPENRVLDAEAVERGGEWGWGMPLPSRLGGLGERRKLPKRNQPRPKTDFGVSRS